MIYVHVVGLVVLHVYGSELQLMVNNSSPAGCPSRKGPATSRTASGGGAMRTLVVRYFQMGKKEMVVNLDCSFVFQWTAMYLYWENS